MDNTQLIKKINQLRKQKRAIILAHIYTAPDVQDIADYVGDSLGLSQKAAALGDDVEIIVFAGVYFMAETAALLSPNKKVLLPDLNAGCPMAAMASANKVKALKLKYPEAKVVCYVNTTADVKALADVCVTSSNAVKIVKSLPDKQILFVPDKSLGAYVQTQVPDKEIVLFPGFCPTHHKILKQFVLRTKDEHPAALLLAHPENNMEILELANYIGSTGQIQNYVAKSDKKEFIIATENGIIYRLEQDNPGKKFYKVTNLATCNNMKRTTLEKIAEVLENESNVITVKKEYQGPALKAINEMLNLS